MLKELKFVQGAVAKKQFIPELAHFKIEDGTIRGYNGSLALSSPIDLDIDCIPKAAPFVKAISNCKETVSMHLTTTGRLAIRSGSFKAFIDCFEADESASAHVVPEGEEIEINGDALLKALKTVQPFISTDASRPWSNGVLLRGQSAYATNNVSMVEYWMGFNIPIEINIPRNAVNEILRINEAPIAMQCTDKSISFHFPDGKWIRSNLLDLDWPDIERILSAPSNPEPLDTRIFEGLDVVKPFTDDLGRVYLNGGAVKTTLIEGEGASYEIENFTVEGVYQLHILSLLKDTATSIDWSLYPKPCIFYGDRLRGALVGMKI
ncbi:DNA polymerase III [Alteromonas phage vB_AcoS-R7M]|uniref:DNA polymerase III n=1 Tax=Alteromonas phage vB_AcoS-R7M TaxID=2729541 RepID=A0A6M3YTH0_9CAUD|nr:DNA polymerase processivity factor [Alteromonas phage vB_AcoS-R7M]QJI53366.1 DNA polymerase III [Alteromonas phage vB_AcoS-R7M]